MSETVTNDKKRHRIKRRLTQLNNRIENELDFREFGATSDLDWKMSDARLAGYNEEIAKLEKLL